MKNKAFTLIELLIAILIIAVLTAIAYPQYKKIVLKTQFSETITALKTLIDAQNRYYLTNGTYTDNRDSLDIEYPLSDTYYKNNKYHIQVSKDLYCGIEGAPTNKNTYCQNNKIGISLLYFYYGLYWCTNMDLNNYYNDELCKKLLNVSKTISSSTSDRRTYEGKRLYSL